jgi:hypothetical protein
MTILRFRECPLIVMITGGRLPPTGASTTYDESALRFDSGAATLALPAITPAAGNDEGERAEHRAELFDRGGGGVRRGVDTGPGRARPESDRDIQHWKRAGRRCNRVAVPFLVCIGSLAAWLAVFRPEHV